MKVAAMAGMNRMLTVPLALGLLAATSSSSEAIKLPAKWRARLAAGKADQLAATHEVSIGQLTRVTGTLDALRSDLEQLRAHPDHLAPIASKLGQVKLSAPRLRIDGSSNVWGQYGATHGQTRLFKRWVSLAESYSNLYVGARAAGIEMAEMFVPRPTGEGLRVSFTLKEGLAFEGQISETAWRAALEKATMREVGDRDLIARFGRGENLSDADLGAMFQSLGRPATGGHKDQ